MNRRVRTLLLGAICVAGLFAGLFVVRFEKSKMDANAAPLPSASVSKNPPVVKITETTIFVDDREVAQTAPIAASTQIQKIDGLFTELKRIQESRRTVAGLPRHQTIIIEPTWNTPMIVLKSAYQTAAIASFDDVEFGTGDGGVVRP